MKRANGRGSISFQRSRGLYAAAVDQGYVNGKRRRKIVFGKTVREVSDKLARLQVAKQTGMLPTRTEKLGPYLARSVAFAARGRHGERTRPCWPARVASTNVRSAASLSS